MLKQEFICPSCEIQYIILSKDREAQYCPFCADPIEIEEQSELEMGDEDE